MLFSFQKMVHVVMMDLLDSHTLDQQELIDLHTLGRKIQWADWKCALMGTGEVCVMTLLDKIRLMLHVDNLDMM